MGSSGRRWIIYRTVLRNDGKRGNGRFSQRAFEPLHRSIGSLKRTLETGIVTGSDGR